MEKKETKKTTRKKAPKPVAVSKKRVKKRPAKRPPKRPSKLSTPRSKTTIELPGVDVELRPGGGVQNRGLWAYLRALAGLVYATDQSRPSIDQVALRAPFVGVMESKTMRVWAQDDQWVERRRAHQDSVLEGVRKRIGNDLIQAQIRMLQDTAGIYDKTKEMLLGTDDKDPPPAKSYESLLRAFTGLVGTLNDVRRDVIDVVVPPPTVGGAALDEEVPRVTPELSAGEARIAALAVVEARRRIQAKGEPNGDGGE